LVETLVYDPTKDREGQKNVGSKNPGKAKEAKKPAQAPPEKKERVYHINKYGFLHVDKDLAKYLGVSFGKDKQDVPVELERIENGFTVRIVKA